MSTSGGTSTGVQSLTAGDGITITGDNGADTIAADTGTTAGTVAAGNDTRFGKVNGVAVTGTPAAGDVLTATSADAADWEPPAAATEISGVTVTGTPTSGQVLTATSADAADWATPASGTGSGVASITAANGTITVGGTSTDPTVEANVGTAAGTVAAGNDARFDQVAGVAVTGTPTEGQVLTATSGTAADWADPADATVLDGVTVTGTPSSGDVLTATGADAAGWAAPSSGGGAAAPTILSFDTSGGSVTASSAVVFTNGNVQITRDLVNGNVVWIINNSASAISVSVYEWTKAASLAAGAIAVVGLPAAGGFYSNLTFVNQS